MSKKNEAAKLRALIRKVVKEELNKALPSEDHHDGPAAPDTFDLDPRFSTGHYTVEQDPFPHSEPNGTKRQSKRQTGKNTSGRHTDQFKHQPVGLFGPMPPGPEPLPQDYRRTGQWPPEPPEQHEGAFPPDRPFNGPAAPESRRSQRGNKH